MVERGEPRRVRLVVHVRQELAGRAAVVRQGRRREPPDLLQMGPVGGDSLLDPGQGRRRIQRQLGLAVPPQLPHQVDTKKKELVGNFKNGGREWQPKGTPPAVLVHDFPTDAEGKAIPYGVYDMARNEAWVSVGWDHDTPAFAVASIRHWWHQMGCGAYPEATTLFITADAGGSNGYRLRAWKHELQQLADETGLTIEVSHFPPGTSKWNKIEHRLFCHITANWRGTPLTTYETIVDRIGNVQTATGLRVRAELDAGEYPTGVTVTKEEMDALALVRDEFHGEWNYKLLPRPS